MNPSLNSLTLYFVHLVAIRLDQFPAWLSVEWMLYLVAPQVEDHQVGEQSQLRWKNLQTVERQIQLLQLQQLPQFIWDVLQEQEADDKEEDQTCCL